MRKRILLIDDEPDFTRIIKLFLEKTEIFELLVANDATSGIQIAKDELPDLVLLDIAMPGISGSEVAEVLINDPSTKDIPIAFLSALVSKKDVEEGRGKIGGRVFIAKPVLPEELVNRIEGILRESEKEKTESE